MSKKTCSVCGLNEKACMHSIQLRDEKTDVRVKMMFWFAIGFLFAIGIMFIEICGV
jgi:predicted nucleic acid-binding Zn ribbon protein